MSFKEPEIWDRSTIALSTDTNLDMHIGRGIYVIYVATLRTESLVANQCAFSLQYKRSDGTTITNNLSSGIVQLHQHHSLRQMILRGPGIFRGQVLKEDDKASHMLVIYQSYSVREWMIKELGGNL